MNIKKYIIDNSELMKEWDEEKNSEIGLYANEITEGSKKKAFWKCSKGHSYPMMICNKTCLHRGCSICSKRRISSDNNLKAVYPELAKEWDYEKNKKRPEEVFPHSNKKYYWICPKGHESYSANPNNRTQGDGCPRCSGNQVSEDNNLLFLFPEIAKEWHLTLNDKKPNEFTAYSNKTATWICENGHVWKAKINNRTHGKGCKECSKGNQSSFPEQAIYYYLKSLFKTTISGCKIDGNEIDVYLPNFKIAIEYDGYRYHKTQKKLKSDINKNIFLLSKGIKLIRIREVGCANMLEENCKIIMCNSESSLLYLKEVIEQLISVISNITNDNYKINVDITKDRFKIRSQYIYSLNGKSLLALNPSLAAEWDYEANFPVTPDKYSPGSEEKVSWICSKNPNHKWQARINSRNRGVGCRFCNGKEACEDNCLATTHPELTKEWDYELNEKTPNDYTYGSKQIVKWKCSKGHPSYPAAINSRTRKDRSRGCPHCSGQKVCLETSIMTLYPNIIEEWDYELNYPLTPDKVSKAYTKSKIWWKCSKGHSYEAYISQRIRGSKCSVCNGRQVIPETSLAFLFPDIAEEWDYEKNKPLIPWDVGKGYDKDIWWKCKNPNHPSFKAKVYNRTKKKTKCPYCRKEHLISI